MSQVELIGAVRALIAGTKVNLTRDGETVGTWHPLPSLWDQLQDSAQRASGTSGGAKFGSRPVISTGLVSLVMEIDAAGTKAAVELVGHTAGSTPENLRLLCELTDAELIGWWTERLHQWCAEARNWLGLDPQRSRSVRGVRCPDCGATTAYIHQGGETVRTPALTILWAAPAGDDYHEGGGWRVQAIECRACGTAWARDYDGMGILIDMMLAANQSRETMAELG